jgi:transposase-like protein
MNIDQLRQRFADENACRAFFESVIWADGRYCPHCHGCKSYRIAGKSARAGLYECAHCKRQFTVTTKTPMHSTKLPLWKWIMAMYLMVNSSKGVSSVFLAKWVGISQKSAWKLGHAIREMMSPGSELQPALGGIVELDEKYIGGKPRFEHGVKHKRGRGTQKQ